MKPLLAVCVALALAACGTRPWNDDETHRISDVMAGDRFDPDLPEARGIPLHQMPPQARPSPRSPSPSPEKGVRGHRLNVRPLTPPRGGDAAAALSRASRQKPAATARRRDRDRAMPQER